ncbi:substrate-binding domain-containing protein [Robinsoniella peoriensis]|uniref:substrate-binding domain-containing protein n=1 Tax=Robinsoniella peoriensis TaxID=180332 RepID=UPI0037537619
MTPELTTVSQPIGEMGKAAVEALIRAVEGKEAIKKLFEVKLIKRETTLNTSNEI